jgi:hypothetical protein
MFTRAYFMQGSRVQWEQNKYHDVCPQRAYRPGGEADKKKKQQQ